MKEDALMEGTVSDSTSAPRGAVPSLRRRIVWRGTLTVAVALILALFFVENRLLATLEAVARTQAAAAVEDAGLDLDGPFATCVPEPPSRRVGRFLERLTEADVNTCSGIDRGTGDARDLARSWLGSINRRYAGQLFFTLALVLPVAVLLAAAAYVLAFLVEQAERKGWRRFSERLIEVVDGVPYILWSIPAILIALAIHRARPFGQSPPYWLYLGLIFLGFGTFLLVFFLRQNRQQIIAQRVVLDGERMTGIGEVRLFWRLFRFSFARTTFPRQCLYGAVFIMLLDFAFFTVLPTHQPGKPSTVFAEGNQFYERTITARADSGCAFRDCYLEQLEILNEARLEDAELGALTAAVLGQPGRALDLETRQDICRRVEQAGSDAAGGQLQGFAGRLALPEIEQEAIFFDQMSRFYIALNCCLTFVLFFTVFMAFDVRVLADE